jgi:renalase
LTFSRLTDPASASHPVQRAVAELLKLPDRPARVFVHRWSFAQPEPVVGAEPYFLGAEGVALAGDAFGKPRVQTAWLSGRALGRALAGGAAGRPS